VAAGVFHGRGLSVKTSFLGSLQSLDRGYISPYTGASRQLTSISVSATRDRVTSGLAFDPRIPPIYQGCYLLQNGHTRMNTVPQLFTVTQTIVLPGNSTFSFVTGRVGLWERISEPRSADVRGELRALRLENGRFGFQAGFKSQ